MNLHDNYAAIVNEGKLERINDIVEEVGLEFPLADADYETLAKVILMKPDLNAAFEKMKMTL